MKTCKTCKFWKEPKEESWEAQRVCHPVDPENNFKPIKMGFEIRTCNSPKIIFFETPPTSSHVALIDGSEYYAKMLTGEDFGCVNHEEEAK
jgi:hypothetical protein